MTHVARKRLLIVDDEELLLRALSRALGRDYEVVILASANQALQRAMSGEAWDLLLCDVSMPEMSGLELAARMTRTCPSLSRRVVLMTGGTSSFMVHAAIQRSGLPVITKPFERTQLISLLAAAVAGE
jgi:DNA-binding NtrC family response regulator